MIKTNKCLNFYSYKPQRWQQVNQLQFINRETSFVFFKASSVYLKKQFL